MWNWRKSLTISGRACHSVRFGKCWWIVKRHPKASERFILELQRAIPR